MEENDERWSHQIHTEIQGKVSDLIQLYSLVKWNKNIHTNSLGLSAPHYTSNVFCCSLFNTFCRSKATFYTRALYKLRFYLFLNIFMYISFVTYQVALKDCQTWRQGRRILERKKQKVLSSVAFHELVLIDIAFWLTNLLNWYTIQMTSALSPSLLVGAYSFHAPAEAILSSAAVEVPSAPALGPAY